MGRTEEIENLRKELFSIQLLIAMEKDNEKNIDLTEKLHNIEGKIAMLEDELRKSNGQLGFAFTDLIEETKLEIKKGR